MNGKPFKVFIFGRYYPDGGYHDFVDSFQTLEEALLFLFKQNPDDYCEASAHIVKYNVIIMDFEDTDNKWTEIKDERQI